MTDKETVFLMWVGPVRAEVSIRTDTSQITHLLPFGLSHILLRGLIHQIDFGADLDLITWIGLGLDVDFFFFFSAHVKYETFMSIYMKSINYTN